MQWLSVMVYEKPEQKAIKLMLEDASTVDYDIMRGCIRAVQSYWRFSLLVKQRTKRAGYSKFQGIVSA